MGGVPGEPDGGEVAPSELGLHDVGSLLEGVAYADGVVPAAPVVLGALVLRRVVAALALLVLSFLLPSPLRLSPAPASASIAAAAAIPSSSSIRRLDDDPPASASAIAREP